MVPILMNVTKIFTYNSTRNHWIIFTKFKYIFQKLDYKIMFFTWRRTSSRFFTIMDYRKCFHVSNGWSEYCHSQLSNTKSLTSNNSSYYWLNTFARMINMVSYLTTKNVSKNQQKNQNHEYCRRKSSKAWISKIYTSYTLIRWFKQRKLRLYIKNSLTKPESFFIIHKYYKRLLKLNYLALLMSIIITYPRNSFIFGSSLVIIHSFTNFSIWWM